MRICLMTPELAPFVYAGIGVYVRDLAEELSHCGAEVTVCGVGIHSPGEIEHVWGRSVSLPVPTISRAGRVVSSACLGVSRLPYVWRLAHRVKGRWNSEGSRKAAQSLSRFLQEREDDFDVVEVPNWPGHGAYLRPRRAKMVVRLSSPAAECGVLGDGTTKLEAASCCNADLVIGNSKAIIEKVAGLYGLDLAKTMVIPHGVADVTVPTAARRKEGLDVLVVGRSERRKGTDILLQALSPVLEAYPSMRVSFVGPDDESIIAPFPELADLWKTLKDRFRGRICCLGRVSDDEKVRLYAASHWVAIPSRFESFGLIAVEGLRAGTPFVAAARGGLVETAQASPESRLIAPNSTAAWITGLLSIAEQGVAAAESLRNACRRTYETKFTARRMAVDSMKAYAELTAFRTVTPPASAP